MQNILSKLLNKRGIKDTKELTQEERVVFDNYEKVLSKDRLSVDDLQLFLSGQISLIETKWKDYEYKDKEKLIPYHTVYKTLLETIQAPQREREVLEKYLNSLI